MEMTKIKFSKKWDIYFKIARSPKLWNIVDQIREKNLDETTRRAYLAAITLAQIYIGWTENQMPSDNLAFCYYFNSGNCFRCPGDDLLNDNRKENVLNAIAIYETLKKKTSSKGIHINWEDV